MTEIYAIRHGKAAAGWGDSADPTLDATGHAQAATLARDSHIYFGEKDCDKIFVSPLLRCQETAQPLCEKWDMSPHNEPRIAEIPSPVPDLSARVAWLRRVMGGTWHMLDNDPESPQGIYAAWRADIMAFIDELKHYERVVLFTHFIVLNVLYCAATGRDDVVSFHPGNASVHLFGKTGTAFELLHVGNQAITKVN